MTQISVYKITGNANPKPVKTLTLERSAPELILKAKATCHLRNRTDAPMTDWQRRPHTREWHRQAGEYEVIIHNYSSYHSLFN